MKINDDSMHFDSCFSVINKTMIRVIFCATAS